MRKLLFLLMIVPALGYAETRIGDWFILDEIKYAAFTSNESTFVVIVFRLEDCSSPSMVMPIPSVDTHPMFEARIDRRDIFKWEHGEPYRREDGRDFHNLLAVGILKDVMEGDTLRVKAGNIIETFSLRGSKKAISTALSSCIKDSSYFNQKNQDTDSKEYFM